jgi:hypothetical protein
VERRGDWENTHGAWRDLAQTGVLRGNETGGGDDDGCSEELEHFEWQFGELTRLLSEGD